MSKKAIYLIGASAIICIILLWWIKNQEIEKLKDESTNKDDYISELEANNFELINEILKTDKTLPDNVKEQIINLIEKYKIRNVKVAIELESVIKLIENGEYEKAVMSITKIIENILKDKFAKDENFQIHLKNENGKKRKAVFNEFIEYAKSIKILTKAECQFALGLKELRNEEAHELAVKREVNFNLGSILTAMELVIKCDNYSLS